ncbi:MAG: DUF3795 domain-containing protein [Pseudomonadota bacterium]
MIAPCGINCGKCPVFLAAKNDDDALRAETAKSWSTDLALALKPEEMNCDGCLAETGRLFKFCRVCEVRSCAGEKSLATCAPCGEFGCSKVQAIWNISPDARKLLEKMRAEA